MEGRWDPAIAHPSLLVSSFVVIEAESARFVILLKLILFLSQTNVDDLVAYLKWATRPSEASPFLGVGEMR